MINLNSIIAELSYARALEQDLNDRNASRNAAEVKDLKARIAATINQAVADLKITGTAITGTPITGQDPPFGQTAN